MSQLDPFDRAVQREQEIRRSRWGTPDDERFIIRWMTWVMVAVFAVWGAVVLVHYGLAGEANTAFIVHLLVYCAFLGLAVVGMVALRVLFARFGMTDSDKPPT